METTYILYNASSSSSFLQPSLPFLASPGGGENGRKTPNLIALGQSGCRLGKEGECFHSGEVLQIFLPVRIYVLKKQDSQKLKKRRKEL